MIVRILGYDRNLFAGGMGFWADFGVLDFEVPDSSFPRSDGFHF